MPEIDNLVHETSTTTGTGNLTLTNVNGKQPFNTAFGNGATTNVFYYFISNRDATEYEWGTGHMSAATTLVRDTVIGGSNGASAVTFSAGTKDVTSAYQAVGYREILTAARTYYVRTDGSDSNTGLVDSAAGAFLTIQKAVDVIASTLDIAGFMVTVQVKDGTYTGGVTLKNVVGYATAGNLVIQGNNGTPANVHVNVTSTQGFNADQLFVTWDIKDLKISTTTSGNSLRAVSGSHLRFGNIDFGSCAGSQIRAAQGGRITSLSAYAITGGATTAHMIASGMGAELIIGNITITVSASLTFGTFASASYNSVITASGNTYTTTTATGTRFAVSNGSVIDTSGGGANYFPGNSAGTGTNFGASPWGLYI